MKRREFIAATAALLVSPRRSWAQGTPRRIGFLGAVRRDWPHPSSAWLDGLRDHGWIEGKNLLVEYRLSRPCRAPTGFSGRARRPQVPN